VVCGFYVGRKKRRRLSRRRKECETLTTTTTSAALEWGLRILVLFHRLEVGKKEERRLETLSCEAEFRDFSELWASFCGGFVLKVQRALLRSSSAVGVLPLLLTFRAAALNCMFVVVVILLSWSSCKDQASRCLCCHCYRPE
jgi:hypothetical protein